MKNKKTFLAVIIFIFVVNNLFGISFQGLDLSDDNRLLFRVDFESQHSLFISRLNDFSLQQITAYPEKLEVTNNGRTLLAHSRFGTVRIPVSGGLPSPLPGYPSFTAGNVPLKGRTQELAASADGQWILYIEPVSPAFGDLLLVNSISGQKRVISSRIELPSRDFPASWSPDSRYFIYSKSGRLFYYPVFHSTAPPADERFRLIGEGRITAINWGQERDFYYFRDNILFHVIETELFTRTIYSDFLSIGSIAGTFPVDFDINFDRYWIAPDAGSVLMSKNGKSILYFPLGENIDGNSIYPHLVFPREVIDFNVLWAPGGQVSVIYTLEEKIVVWRFVIEGTSFRTSTPREIPSAANCALSPDGTKVVFWGETGLQLWDHANWRLLQILSREPVLSCVWINDREIAAGNIRVIECIDVSNTNPSQTPPRRIICLSGAEEFAFELPASDSRAEGSGSTLRILAKAGIDWYVSNGISPWIPVIRPRIRPVSLTSVRYRVFLDSQPTGAFRNVLMIRDLISTATVSLMANHSVNSIYPTAVFPVALCFDLYDDDAGLSQVLNALRRHNIKATFFLNGDFIRRNPLSAAAIVEAGHEAASLFYAPIDFSDSRYRTGADFIIQGLARNEDEFFKVTRKELSLLWHPPFYRSSDVIKNAAASVGYFTVDRDIDLGDWISRADASRLGLQQYSAAQLIEQIMTRKKHSAVIPIRLGKLSGGRDDYLFHNIDVLLDALIRSGCEIVPVSAVTGR